MPTPEPADWPPPVEIANEVEALIAAFEPVDTHGPDTDCAACHECPTCDGIGWSQYGPEILIRNPVGQTVIGCADCFGDGVACPNYDPEKTNAV